MKEQIIKYRKAIIIEKYLSILSIAFVLGLLLGSFFPNSYSFIITCTLFTVLTYYFNPKMWILGFFTFLTANFISFALKQWNVSDSWIGFSGLVLLCITAFVLAAIEDRFTVIKGFIRKRQKYS